MTKRSSKWLFRDCEVVHFNGERIINLRQEINDVPLASHDEDQVKESPTSKDIQEVLQSMRDHQEIHRLSLPGPFNQNNNFLTLVS